MGTLYVLVGPSGTGKTTQTELLKARLGFFEAISHTTRVARPDDLPGSYFHITMDEFIRMKDAGEFVEPVAYPGAGKMYGSSRVEVESKLAQGDVVIVAEGNGARQFLEHVPGTRVIFLFPPTEFELRRRMVVRLIEAHNQEIRDEFLYTKTLAELIAQAIPDIERRISIIEHEIEWSRIAHHKIDPGTIEEIHEQIAAIVTEYRERNGQQATATA